MIKKVTYNQLAKALATLGFKKVEHSEFTVFKNDEYDAMIVLPKGTGTTELSQAHLLMIERTVTEKGVAELSKFSETINRVRRRSILSTYTQNGSVVSQVQVHRTGRSHRKIHPTTEKL